MDKGYDSEKMHRFIRETLNADSIIPARSHNYSTNVWGKYRKEMTENFDTIRYRRRFLVETKFSVIKRRFGADLKSRIFQIQKKEISCKIILANLDRFIQFVWIEVFYRAKFFKQGPVKKFHAGSACKHFKQGLLKNFHVRSG